MVPAFEIMLLTPAIKTMIRDGKVHQIDGVISQSRGEGMVTMDASLLKLLQDGVITRETALEYAQDAELLEKRIKAALQ